MLPPPRIKLIGSSDLARILGCSPSAVTRACKDGRITPAAAAANGRPLFDHEAAAAQWRAHTRQRADGPTLEQGTPAARDLRDHRLAFAEHRARRERAQATAAEIALAKDRGVLIEQKTVEYALANLAAAILEQFAQLPERAAPLLAHSTEGQARARSVLIDECERMQWAIHHAMDRAAAAAPASCHPDPTLS